MRSCASATSAARSSRVSSLLPSRVAASSSVSAAASRLSSSTRPGTLDRIMSISERPRVTEPKYGEHMTYRDDRDADRARIESLEAELAQANQRVAELEGRREQALVLAGGGALDRAGHKSASQTWFGAPLRLALVQRFE